MCSPHLPTQQLELVGTAQQLGSVSLSHPSSCPDHSSILRMYKNAQQPGGNMPAANLSALVPQQLKSYPD